MRPVALALLLAGCANKSREEERSTEEIEPAPVLDAPGQVTMRRLTADMVDRSLRDLLAIESTPAQDRFPAEADAHGFDHLGAPVTLTLVHLEMAEAAIDAALAEALTPPVVETVHTYEPEDSSFVGAGVQGETSVVFDFTSARTSVISVEHSGFYTFQTRACGTPEDDALPQLEVTVDGEVIQTFDVTAGCPLLMEQSFDLELTEGLREVGVGLANDPSPPTNTPMSLTVEGFDLIGPLGATGEVHPGREQVYVCDSSEEACARRILEAFVPRTWRRPVTAGEIDELMDLYGEASSFEEGVQLALKLALLSPQFLFLVEEETESEDLSSWELASRMSFFLWSTIPDAELVAAAADGSLLEPAIREAQVRRMLADPKAEALVDNLARQWFGLGLLAAPDQVSPDPNLFPFSEALRASMHTEMELFSRSMFLDDRPMTDLVTSSDHYVDGALSDIYGVSTPIVPFSKVEVPQHGGGGLTGLAGWLTATSLPTRTSPVKRGAWVLTNLLCEEPAPPPPGVEGGIDEGEPTSMREQLEQHRADPLCASCHDSIDPLGLPFEGFDAVGQFRTFDEWGNPIDANAAEMLGALSADPRFDACMVEKTFVYALGRGPVPGDEATLAEIQDAFVSKKRRFAELAVAIVASDAFTKRGTP